MTAKTWYEEASCDGPCREHRGEIRYVKVVHPSFPHDWSALYYCEEAIAELERLTFKVTPLDSEPIA